MAIANQMNQFELSALKGAIARGSNPFTLPVYVDPDQAGSLIPGDVVKISTQTPKVITVLKCAVTDTGIGVVLRSPKKNEFVAGDAVEIGLFGTILYLESAAAITAGADLEYVVTGAKVQTNAGVYPILGVALTAATGTGQLIIAQLKTAITVSPTITNGTINNCPIGQATPAAGSFTTLTASGNVAVNTNKFTVTAASGNTVIAGTCAVAGKLTAPVIGSGAAVVVTPGATPAIDATQGKIFTVTPAEHEAFTTTGGVVGQEIFLIVTTSGTSSFNLSFTTGFGANAGTLATGTTNAKKFVLKFVHDGTSFVEVSRTAAM
jgi:hypothetical protein